MKCQFEYLPYAETGKFSGIVLDYINGADALRSFYEHPPTLEGIKSAIAERQRFKTNRPLLVQQLRRQYEGLQTAPVVRQNIDALAGENTFTVCTAHQPNLFTGHLYFIYKILHTVRLANNLKRDLPQYNFVPVFYMGSEDADLQELNHIVLEGETYTWHTPQRGAVGRMKVDDSLLKLMEKISGRLLVEKYGAELVRLLKSSFIKGTTIEQATFLFVHHLFEEFGVVVLLPDNAVFKGEMIKVFEDDIFNHTSSDIVNRSSAQLSEHYRVQAYPREINLFYLADQIRNRIVAVQDRFVVHDTDLVFTAAEIKKEIHSHPERFSPNVILRGLFQEVILPDVAWIGGGGELAYWLQLKELFRHYKVPYPVLVLRNSFLIADKRAGKLLEKLHLTLPEVFEGQMEILNRLVRKQSGAVLDLQEQKKELESVYDRLRSIVHAIDPTLAEHTSALERKHLKKIMALEKKMLRAEKRKFGDQRQQLQLLFSLLFPADQLQERVENFMLLYGRLGPEFFQLLYDASPALEQQFSLIRLGE